MKIRYFSALFSIVFLVGCGGSGDSIVSDSSIVIPSSYTPNDGRVLTSVGCAQCHGTNGNSVTSWDSIAGEGEFATENFHEYPIMQTIADGYNLTEKRVIDSWLNTMSENHDDDNDEEDDD